MNGREADAFHPVVWMLFTRWPGQVKIWFANWIDVHINMPKISNDQSWPEIPHNEEGVFPLHCPKTCDDIGPGDDSFDEIYFLFY